jgi:hypothetical protein
MTQRLASMFTTRSLWRRNAQFCKGLAKLIKRFTSCIAPDFTQLHGVKGARTGAPFVFVA